MIGSKSFWIGTWTSPSCWGKCSTFGMATINFKCGAIHKHGTSWWKGLAHVHGQLHFDIKNKLVEFLTIMMNFNKCISLNPSPLCTNSRNEFPLTSILYNVGQWSWIMLYHPLCTTSSRFIRSGQYLCNNSRM
jgi:hypothetical protein